MNKPILIASSGADEFTYGPVQAELAINGYESVVYKTDRVLWGDESFTLSLDDSGNLCVSYEGQSIAPDDVGAGWYRKVANFAVPDAATNLSKQLYLQNEVRALHGTIWPLYPEDVWLNAPARIGIGEQKLRQLILAREVGFTIFETMVTNDWSAVSELQVKTGGQMAVKMMRGIIADNNQLKSFHTTPLSPQDLTALRSSTIPFPGLIQPFGEKRKEWRVTVVGENVFSAAIYTDDIAKDDWRKHQKTGAVQFKNEKISDAISEQCIRYLAKLGLMYGAFDFIEQPDGQVIFLECNPNGQYGWLEDELGLPIAQSIALHLIAIAQRRA